MSGVQGEGPRLVVRRCGEVWRWEFVAPPDDGAGGEGVHLAASIAFVDEDEARDAATAAYPGVPVVADVGDEPPPPGESRRPESRRPESRRPGSRRPGSRRLVLALGLVVVAAFALRRSGRPGADGPRSSGAPSATGPAFPVPAGPSILDAWRRGAEAGREHRLWRTVGVGA